VDAFCVEHGRWRGERDGRGTAGRFGTSDVVATSKVRAAGQYKKSQGEVWSKVSEANAANRQRSASDTFLASVDDATLTRQRGELASKIEAALASAPPDELVGIAYAIDGDVRGVRWFSHRAVFALARRKLVQGIALEALTARAEAEAHGRAATPPKPAPLPAGVDAFVENVEAEQVKEQRDTPAANINEYKESAKGYGSKTMLKGASSQPGPARAVSSDFVSK